MSFVEVESLANSFYRISSYLDHIETMVIDKSTAELYQDLIYRAAFSISLNIYDFIANNCYLAIPGLELELKDGLFLSNLLTIEECLDRTKGRLLRLSSYNDRVHDNVTEILNKGSFYKEYCTKLIHDIAYANVGYLLIK